MSFFLFGETARQILLIWTVFGDDLLTKDKTRKKITTVICFNKCLIFLAREITENFTLLNVTKLEVLRH